MTCKCISYNQPQPGQTDDEVLLTPPGWAQSERGAIPVDACIAPVVQALWDAGVWTRGSCCGHGDPENRSVLVDKSDRLRAEQALREIDPTIRVGAWELVWSDATDAAMQTLADLGQACDAGDVERVAEAIWVQGYGRHRKNAKWPDDVIGGSQELFRGYARAALSAMSPADAGDVRRKALDEAVPVPMLTLLRWQKAMADWDDGGREALDEIEDAVLGAGDFSASAPPPPQPVPTVREAAQRLMIDSEARDVAFDAMWKVATEDFPLEVTGPAGTKYSITGDVVNRLWYEGLRALSAREDRDNG